MNYMKQIAEMLGIELDEEFMIEGRAGTFRLTTGGVIHNDSLYDDELRRLIAGTARIIKLPWKPKRGDLYVYVNVNGDICASIWFNDVFDVAMFLVGNCFRTEAEAEAHKDEVLAKMKEVMGE